MKYVQGPIVSEVEIDGKKFISEFGCSSPIRFLTEEGEMTLLPENTTVNDGLIKKDVHVETGDQ